MTEIYLPQHLMYIKRRLHNLHTGYVDHKATILKGEGQTTVQLTLPKTPPPFKVKSGLVTLG